MTGLILRHDASLGHETGLHPERPDRIAAVERELASRDWLGYHVRDSPRATGEQLDAIHPREHRAALEALCAAGGGAIDADTVVSRGSWEAALHGAGGAAALVDALLSGEAGTGASLHRPPGHHAEAARAMGFCLLNNVAVAARHALDAHGLERVLILDWDVHHGNGTNDIFHADERVLFASIHESPLYPGSGGAGDVGSGAAIGTTINLPVPGGSGDELFTALVDTVVAPAARAFAPQLLLVSAGFDAHADDPLASCTVSDDGFARMAAAVRALSAELEVPAGLVLEGGYDLGALARSLIVTLEQLGGAPRALSPASHPLAERALERVREHTPLA